MKINLFSTHYQCGDKARQKELDYCLRMNMNNPFIDEIIGFENRPKFSHFFEETKNHPNDINIIANSDIYFDETLEHIKGIRANECYALTRWELDGKEVVQFEVKHTQNKEAKPQHSQDVWAFLGACRPIMGGFYLGVPGCDNRIAYEISRAGYALVNPCRSIRAIHKHKSAERKYNIPLGSPLRIGGPYKWVYPQEITLRKPI